MKSKAGVPLLISLERGAQAIGAILLLADFKLQTGQVHGRWRDVQLRHRSGDHRVAHRRLGRSSRHRSRSRRALRSMPRPVEALPCGSRSTISTCSPIAAESGAEIDRGRGFADAALLVGDGQDTRPSGFGARQQLIEGNDLRLGGRVERRSGRGRCRSFGWDVRHF